MHRWIKRSPVVGTSSFKHYLLPAPVTGTTIYCRRYGSDGRRMLPATAESSHRRQEEVVAVRRPVNSTEPVTVEVKVQGCVEGTPVGNLTAPDGVLSFAEWKTQMEVLHVQLKSAKDDWSQTFLNRVKEDEWNRMKKVDLGEAAIGDGVDVTWYKNLTAPQRELAMVKQREEVEALRTRKDALYQAWQDMEATIQDTRRKHLQHYQAEFAAAWCSAINNGSISRWKMHDGAVQLIAKLDDWRALPASVLVSPYLYGSALVMEYRAWLIKEGPELLTVKSPLTVGMLLESEATIRAALNSSPWHPAWIALRSAHRLQEMHKFREHANHTKVAHQWADARLGYWGESFRRFGFHVCTESRRRTIADLTRAMMTGSKGVFTPSGPTDENWPHVFLTTLPRQGRSMVLDEVRRSLLDAGYFCVSICYTAGVGVSRYTTPLEVANQFWQRAILQLKWYFQGSPPALDTSACTFELYRDIVRQVWPKLLEYHPALNSNNHLVVLVDDFHCLLQHLQWMHAEPTSQSVLSAMTKDYKGVSMIFGCQDIAPTIPITIATGRHSVYVPLPAIEPAHRKELSDIFLLVSVAEEVGKVRKRYLSAGEYHEKKFCPALLADDFYVKLINEFSCVSPWIKYVGICGGDRNFNHIKRLLDDSMQHVLSTGQPIDAASRLGAALQPWDIGLGLVERNPTITTTTSTATVGSGEDITPTGPPYIVRLYPAAVTWISKEVARRGMKSWHHRTDGHWSVRIIPLLQNEVMHHPRVQVLLTVAYVARVTVEKHAQRHQLLPLSNDGLKDFGFPHNALLTCVVALVSSLRLCIQRNVSSLFPIQLSVVAPTESTSSCDDDNNSMQEWIDHIQRTASTPHGVAIFALTATEGVVVIDVAPSSPAGASAHRAVTITMYATSIDRNTSDDASSTMSVQPDREAMEMRMKVFLERSRAALEILGLRLARLEYVRIELVGVGGWIMRPASAPPRTIDTAVTTFAVWSSEDLRRFVTPCIADLLPDWETW